MKGLKKLALATAVAAAPFAQAMESLDDSMLAEMTGQAGITIDVNLDLHIDAVKYVDQDGNTELVNVGTGGNYDENGNAVAAGTGAYDKVAGSQGSITVKGITMNGNEGTLGNQALIHGITIDADGSDGLVMGLNRIGGDDAGIDITVDAVLINSGDANLTQYAAFSAHNASMQSSFILNKDDMLGVDGASVSATLGEVLATDLAAAGAAATPLELSDANDAATNAGYANFSAMAADALGGNATAQGEIDTLDAAGNSLGVAAKNVTEDRDATVAATAFDPTTGAPLGAVSGALAVSGQGNIGGFAIENFRNYIQNDLVEEYNARFNMALADSDGNINGVAGSAAAGGRYVRGEIVINGTGNYVAGTSGLRISGKFGGAMDKAAWVDDGGEFGVADLGFFHGVDNNDDGISDTIEGMHFSVDIDVVDNHTSSVAGSDISGGDIAVGDTVSALKISNMAVEGTIMMGEIYVGNTTTGSTLGSVLIKDIDMTGTEVFIYGH